jgi:hypothetical protein
LANGRRIRSGRGDELWASRATARYDARYDVKGGLAALVANNLCDERACGVLHTERVNGAPHLIVMTNPDVASAAKDASRYANTS